MLALVFCSCVTQWFEVWVLNVEAAVAAGHRLVVYYFKGEVGQGKVPWEDVAEMSQLRDAVLKKRG